jgi:preprotein translocase subunit YajC
MLISPAYAQEAAGGGGADPFMTFLPLILIFAVFYFLLIRPQQKKVKEHKAMVGALKRGDRIVTAGGMLGTVAKTVGDNELEVEIAQGTRVRVVRSTVSEVLGKGTLASASRGGKKGRRKEEPEDEAEDEAANDVDENDDVDAADEKPSER